MPRSEHWQARSVLTDDKVSLGARPYVRELGNDRLSNGNYAKGNKGFSVSIEFTRILEIESLSLPQESKQDPKTDNVSHNLHLHV